MKGNPFWHSRGEWVFIMPSAIVVSHIGKLPFLIELESLRMALKLVWVAEGTEKESEKGWPLSPLLLPHLYLMGRLHLPYRPSQARPSQGRGSAAL